MSNQHSNVRELMAILLSIRAFRPLLSGKHIQILSDNVTSVAYINHQGGPIPNLTNIAKDIWAEAICHNITISARHLAGKENTLADELSRQVDKHEWMLAPPAFSILRLSVGSTHRRPVRISDIYATTGLQQQIQGPKWYGSRRAGSVGLEDGEQLRKCPLPTVRQGADTHRTSEGACNGSRAALASPALVREACQPSSDVTDKNSPKIHHTAKPGHSRTTAESTMEALRLEDMWRSQALQRGWSVSSASRLRFSCAANTLQSYNRYINRIYNICDASDRDFPPCEKYLADCLLQIAYESDRPCSLLNCTVAAMGHVYAAYNMSDVTNYPLIRRLITSLVK